MSKKFYVYVHRYASGPKQGQVFYVGKGTKGKTNRASSKRARNAYWKNIVTKYGFEWEIVKEFNHNQCALVYEMLLISSIGRGNLCNLTSGGEGSYEPTLEQRLLHSLRMSGENNPNFGNKHSEEVRRKISAANKNKIIPPDVRRKISEAGKGRKHSEESKRKISSAKLGKKMPDGVGSKIRAKLLGRKTHSEEAKRLMSATRTGKGNARYNHTVYKFKHKNGDEFVGTMYEFYTSIEIKQHQVSRLVSGERSHVYGWCFAGKQEQ